VLLRPINVDQPLPAAGVVGVAGAGDIAVGLLAGPLAADIAAASALVALLHTEKCVSRAVARVCTLWNGQGCVSAGRAHVLLEDGLRVVLGVTAHAGPDGGRGAQGGGSGCCGGCG
jgi:hypothetical protein